MKNRVKKLVLITVNLLTIFFSAHLAVASSKEGTIARSGGLDVNDVSYIFPLDAQNKPFPLISLDSGLLSPELFVEVLSMGQGDASLSLADRIADLRQTYLFKYDVITNLKNWYVVSFRYENCGDNFALDDFRLKPSTQTCSARLRVVAQPLPSSGLPVDTALHLVYKVGQNPANASDPVVQALLKLKSQALTIGVDTSKMPLQPHPALQQNLEQGRNDFAQAVESFFRTSLSANPTQQLQIATIIAATGVSQWKFMGGLVDHSLMSPHWHGFNATIYQNLTSLQALSLNCGDAALCAITPQVTSSFAVTQFPRLTEMFATQNAEQYTPSVEYQKLSEIIDQPQQAHMLNTDCISCHQTATQRSKSKLLVSNLTPMGITPFVSGKYLSGDSTAVINFGYQGQSARISVRTVEESAMVADAVNKVLGRANPGYRCPLENRENLWSCLNSTASNSNSCYEQFCTSM